MDEASTGVVLDLTTSKSEYAKRFISNAILAYAFTNAKSKRLKKLFVILEEAHNVAPRSAELTMTEKVFMEGRKYGIHVVAVTQSPKKLSEGIVKNAALKIIHSVKDVEDAKYLANSIGYPELWKEFVELEVGHAYFYYRKPIRVVVTPDSNWRKASTPPQSEESTQASHTR